MLQELRTFVHWFDAILHVDCTREKTDAVYAVVNSRLEDEKKAEQQEEESSKQTFSLVQSMVTSALPAIIGLLGKDKPKPEGRHCCPPSDHAAPGHQDHEPVRINRPQVVVDRAEQQGRFSAEPEQEAPPAPPAPAEVRPEEVQMMNKIDELVRAIPFSMQKISERMELLEERIQALEVFVGKDKNVAASPV